MVLQGITSLYDTRCSRRSTQINHQGILEEEARADHNVDVLPRFCRIIEIRHAGIERGVFPDGSEARDVIDVMMAEALQCRRQRRNRGSRDQVRQTQ